MTTTLSRTFSILTLLAIFAGGTALRVPGVYWGDGELKKKSLARWHVDEETHVNVAKQFLEGKIDYGYFYVKGFGVHIAAVAFLGKLAGGKISTDDLYRIGRWISIFYGLATILLVYLSVFLVSKNQGMALMAASFMAICSLAVTNSHFATADSASCFWIWVAALFCRQGIVSQKKWAGMGAWASCGMALGVKVSVAIFAPLLLLFWAGKDRWEGLISGLPLAGMVFLTINGWGIGLEGVEAIWGNIFGDNISVIPQHTGFETIFTVFISIFPSFSFPIILLSFAGLSGSLQGIRNHPTLWACLASPVVIHALSLFLLDDPFERHLLPLAPALCGLAAFGWGNICSDKEGVGIRKILGFFLLYSYLIFFAVDGEYPFWRDNRTHARNWILKEVNPGSKILEGPYAWLSLPEKKYRTGYIKLRSKKFPEPEAFDVIVLHEFHTYRYERSRLSPFRKPLPDNIYHPDGFGLKYWAALKKGKGPFKPVRRFQAPGQWSLERMLYKRYWGTFTSFVGDVYVFSLSDD